MRRTWYFVAPTSKARDFYNLLHLPYTGMVLSFVVMGAAFAPRIFADRLLATMLAYFFGLGVAAHALDQLEPGGSSYTQRLTRHELVGMAVAGLVGALGIGAYFALSLTPILFIFMGTGIFFALAYPLPSYVAGGLFHNNLSFAFSWGFLPFLTSYFVNSLSITPEALVLGVPMALAAWIEIVLSRSARKARLEGLPGQSYRGSERALKLLVLIVYSVAIALVLARLK